MLKKFFLNALSAFVGAWAAIILVVVAGIMFFFGFISSFFSSDDLSVGKGSVLQLKLSGIIEETESAPQFDYYSLMRGDLSRPQALNSIVNALSAAKNNSNIEALLIDCAGSQASPATLDAVRNAVTDFKQSGKRVIAYGDNLTMGDYFVATAADEVYLNPAGSLDIQGITGTSLYYKELLDKIGISFDVVKVGTYKSAVEPYVQNEMSEPARLQLDSLYNQMWGLIRSKVADARKIPSSRVDSLVNHFIFLDEASTAKNYHLVDGCIYRRELNSVFAAYTGRKPEEIKYVSCDLLSSQYPWGQGYNDNNQIAVLYAVGDIAEFEGAGINCEKLVPLICKLAEDPRVKGMVLRVNSPGGSVFGSEQIGEALDFFKSKGKKLAVSMGDYAASGGYWISAGADRIFADPLTITGSIGIFGLVPNIQGLTQKIGVHPQTVSTNPGVNFPSIFTPLSPEQHEALQKNVERGYDKFIDRVAGGRNKKPAYIESIASGRVWDAVTAKQLGLVDKLGSLEDAISWVADQENIANDYSISVYPRMELNLLNILPSAMMQNSYVSHMMESFGLKGDNPVMVNSFIWLLMQNKLQARALNLKMTM